MTKHARSVAQDAIWYLSRLAVFAHFSMAWMIVGSYFDLSYEIFNGVILASIVLFVAYLHTEMQMREKYG